jgi:hypothetical protein
MKTKTKFSRFGFALMFALCAIGFSAQAALADQPIKYELPPFTVPSTLTDVCSFPIDVNSTIAVDGTDFYDHQGGALIRSLFHIDAQDTISANGKTLVGDPFTYNIDVLYDSNLNITGFYVDGVAEKLLLPDGSQFITAGRADLSDTPFATYLSPDHGNPGDIAGLCAALAP